MLAVFVKSRFEERNKNKINDAFYIKYKKDFSFSDYFSPFCFVKNCRGIIFKKKMPQSSFSNLIKRIEQLAGYVLYGGRGYVLKRI